MNIYIISSFRTLPAVHLLRDALRSAGHTVIDFAVKAPPLPDSMPLAERRRALDSDERGDIFRFCTEACASSDLCIYVGPAGQDAACEVGIAYTSGVPVFALTGPLEKPGLVISGCISQWHQDPDTLLEAVQDLQFKLTSPDMEGE